MYYVTIPNILFSIEKSNKLGLYFLYEFYESNTCQVVIKREDTSNFDAVH